jgi:hypothetical protein
MKRVSSGLLHALLLVSPLVVSGCDDSSSTDAHALPPADVVQPVPNVDTSSPVAQVASRAFGGGYVMFELDRAVDATKLDLAKTRLMTVRPDASGELQVIEAAGDMFLADDGRTIAVELADQPRAGDLYRAITNVDGVDLDLGDIVVRAPSDDADFNQALYLEPTLVGTRPEAPGSLALQLLSSVPADGSSNNERDMLRVTIKYSSASQVDCANPIAGIQGFHLYSVEPYLAANRQQNMYPNMVVGYGPTPTLVCDAARNQISMELPGLLLGGATFKVDTQARATDGSTLSVTTTFRTKNPGLQIYMTKATNEIYECDTHWPGSSSYRCDVYLMSMAKTRVSSSQAWQVNTKIPASGDWANWAEDTSKLFTPPNHVTLYQDAIAVGDPMALELHAYDSDTGDGYKKALSFLGGLGKVASPFYPPAGVIGEGLTQIANALPVDDDDFEGGGTYFLPKAGRWGTVTRNHTFKLPGRPLNSQIVINFTVSEYPAPWYAPAIID